MSDSASLTLDGNPIEIHPGESLLALTRRAGAEVPSLCYDDRLKGYGSCRMCVVKVNGRIVASCTLPADATQTVVTDDEELRRLRKGLGELTLSLLPEGECQACKVRGGCEMHTVATQVDATSGRFAGTAGGAAKADDNPFLGRNYDLCINCYRCVRICDEIEGDNAITAMGRGFATTIATWMNRGLEQSSCEFCGQCIHTCPTGALFDLKIAKKIPLDLHPSEIKRVDTTCPYCGTGCGLTLNTARGKLLGVTPQMHAGASHGALCVKGQFGVDFIDSEERLTHPLIRQPDGSFKKASWEEAVTLVAGKFRSVRDEFGPDAFAGWASSRTTSESNYLFMKFVRGAMGTDNLDNCQRT